MLHVTEYFAKLLSHSWLLEMAPFDRLHTSSYWLSIVTVALSCVISEIKRNIGRKLRFFHAPCIKRSRYGGPSEYCHIIWCRKTRMLWLPDGEKSLMICLAVSTQYRRVTDGHLATAQSALTQRIAGNK